MSKKSSLALFSLLLGSSSCVAQPRLLLIETGLHDPYLFHFFIKQAEAAGFSVTFYSLHKDVQELKNYDAIFIALDSAAIMGAYGPDSANHELNNRLKMLFKECSELHSKMIGFILPNAHSSSVSLYYRLCTQILGPFSELQNKDLLTFLSLILRPQLTCVRAYDTSLLLPDSKTTLLKNTTSSIKNSKLITFAPTDCTEDQNPLMLYLYNNVKNNQVIITKRSLVAFGDIAENFFFNPIEQPLRVKLYERIQAIFNQLCTACKEKKKEIEFNKERAELPFDLQYEPHGLSLLNEKRDLSRLVLGWGAPESYYGKEKEAAQTLISSDLSALWMEWNPEWYLGSHGVRKEQRRMFLDNINALMKALAEEQKNSNKKIPEIFVGTDITSNYIKREPLNEIYDIFGKKYPNIPSPLDFDNFWKVEVLDVFDEFFKEWAQIGEGVPWSGIFFDLEMYHAQNQANQYTSDMDFSLCAWECYRRQKASEQNIPLISSIPERVNYLVNHHQMDEYFSVLKQEAALIGRKLKEHMKKKIPALKFGVYNIHLPYSWFYTGFLSGLSSKEEPVMMATFSMEFQQHKEWLERQGVYLKHLPVILLSKLKKEEDFTLLNKISRGHDGIWFNRFSRLNESRDKKDWQWDYGLEVSPLETDHFISLLQSYLKKQNVEESVD